MTKAGGIYLGMHQGEPVFYRGDRHALTFGPTGSGKGTGLIIPTLAQLRQSCVVIDCKGESAAVTAARRRLFGDVVMFNPFEVLVDHYDDLASQGFNPLLGVDPDSESFTEDAMAVAESYVIDNAGNQDKHWVEGARELVGFLTMFECTHENPSLVNVREMLGLPYERVGGSKAKPPETREGLAVEGKRAQPQNWTIRGAESLMDIFSKVEQSQRWRELRSKAQRFMEISDELRGVLASARTQTQSLDSKRLRADLGKGGAFRFESMKEKITTVFVVIPPSELEKHARWLRLVVNCALRAMLKTPASKELGRVLFLLDEFATLQTFGPIESAMGYARGYGVQIWAVLQDLVQLKRHYEVGWESFIAASGTLTAYAPQDLTTGEYISRLSGTTSKEVQTVSQDRETLEWRPSIASQGFPLYLPQDLMGMQEGELLCRVQGLSGTFRTRGVRYTETPFYNGPGGPLRKNPYYV